MRARKAGLWDVGDICRICGDGWRDTYAGVYGAEEIQRAVARYCSRERVREEVQRPEDWDGWWVAESLPFYRARGFVERGTRPRYGADAGDDRVSLRLSRRI